MPPPWYRGSRTEPVASQASAGGPDEDFISPAGPSTLERPRDCINKHPTPAFAVLCSMMDRLRSEEAGKRKDTLQRFFRLWREKVGSDLYPLIRLLLPDRDRERPVYNLKEAMLAKCYIEVLGLDKHSEAAQRLIKWKQPIDGQADAVSGDFARVCYHEIAARSTVEEGQLTIDAVNSLLDQLAAGRLRQADYVPILRKINQQCTPVEQEWIIRIILKDLRISIREKGVFAVFHPDAGDLFNVCSDLKRVCWTLYKPDIRLEKNQTNIELFRSFLPQLCYRSPSSSPEMIAKLVGGPTTEFVMEEKLDGERMQLHMRGSGAQWYYCSRKAKDYTYLYGAHIGEGSLTQFIAGAFHDDVRNIILDGEMLVWDPIVEKYLAFGTLKTAASVGTKMLRDLAVCPRLNGPLNICRMPLTPLPRLVVKVFDVLFLNDKCITHKRLSERKRLLRSNRIFRDDLENFKGRIEFAEESKGKTGKDIRNMLERILETKGEGVVVKKPDSVYQTNARSADWVKVKPEYADQMGENLDLLVLGGWWGKGGRTGKISVLLCGLRVPQEDDGSGETPQFTSFVKIGSGMSYTDYEWIMNKHGQHLKPFDRKNPPPWMQLGQTGLDDKPDVYIHPDNSFAVEVKAAEISPAIGNFGAGYTMRFPRCKFIYYDKASRDHPLTDDSLDRDQWTVLSVQDFMNLVENPKRKYVDDENGTARRKKRKPTTRKKVQLLSSVIGQKIADDNVESGIFHDITFYIPKGTPEHKKADLEALVHKHGGEFTQAQLSDLSAFVIAPDNKSGSAYPAGDLRVGPLVKAQIRKGVSIIKPEWIFASIERRRPIPLIEEYVIHQFAVLWMLVHASDEAKEDRYYHKTLEEIDGLSLVRGRTGRLDDEEEEEEGEGEAEAEREEDQSPAGASPGAAEAGQRRKSGRVEPLEAEKTTRQKEMDEEWGLYRDDNGNERGASSHRRRGGGGGSDSEGELDQAEEEDYASASENDSHPSDQEDVSEDETGDADEAPDQAYRLLPVRDLKAGVDDPHAMGEDAEAIDYDTDKIFYHLVFYMDTPENAEKNGLASSGPPKAARERHRSDALLPLSLSSHLPICPETSRVYSHHRLGRDAARRTNRDGANTDGSSCRLDQAQKLLRENGGRIVDDIHHPKLTHIVMDNDDSGRYGELVRKTAKWVKARRERPYFLSRRCRVLPLP
ncbi:DNA ligase 4 [Saitozyma sp. JCM 24511]|nr:DNA ligase 4 [Saitozyma sp. JCM 24511]